MSSSSASRRWTHDDPRGILANSGGDQKGSNRVIRGGSWNNSARNVRAAYRNGNHPGNRNDNLGFRLSRAQSSVDADE